MNKTLQIVLGVLLAVVVGCGLVYFGFTLGRNGWSTQYGYMSQLNIPMFSRFINGSGSQSNDFNQNWNGRQFMMGEYISQAENSSQLLTIDEVDEIIHEYLEDSTNDGLILGEIMIFENHAYAQIVEDKTGMGAKEVIIDFKTKSVYPEQGPNMMWNQKYSPMGSMGRFFGSGMMSGSYGDSFDGRDVPLEDYRNMPVTSEKAVEEAQVFLNKYFPGYQADKHADPFYGYYTLHVLQDGNVIGMLSVNGLSGQVFYHNWHGDFIGMSEHQELN